MKRILTLFLLTLAIATPSLAKTIYVNIDGGADVRSITEGIQVAMDGDVLSVAPGIYPETNMLVYKSLTIQGETPFWPIVDGQNTGTIFRVQWGKSVTFKNLVLRNAPVGIMSRLAGHNCGAASAPWSVDSVVLYNMTEAGLAADNETCAVGSTTWSNVLAMNCATAYLINDYGNVTASGMVALNCGFGTNTWNFATANFTCCIFWNNTTNSGGPDAIRIPGLIHADPLVHLYPTDTATWPFICVHPTLSPCLVANNACNAVIGVLSTGPCPAPTAVPTPTPLASRLGQSTPNPFTFSMTIPFELAGEGETVSLRVYDVAGRLVRTLLDRRVAGGPASVEWDGRDDHGRQVSSGLYFYRLTTATASEVKKAVLLR